MNKVKLSTTNIIIALNVAIYIVMMLSGNSSVFIAKFAVNSPYNSIYITSLTSAFLHTGIFHIGFNMMFLFYIGPLLENYLGKVKFGIYYIACAFISGYLTSMFSSTLVIGASGVLYAILATVIALDRSDVEGFTVYNSRMLLSLLMYNIIITIFIPGISVIGHISGLVAGLIAALVIMSLKQKG